MGQSTVPSGGPLMWQELIHTKTPQNEQCDAGNLYLEKK